MRYQLRGVFALLVVTLVWGTTFPAMKALTAHLSPAWIVFSRFAIAAVLLAPFLLRGARADLRSGLLLGLLLFFCYVFQVEGLALTTSNRNAFICGLNVLIVPLLGIVAGRPPERRIALALLLAVSGLAALCWDGGAWRFGDTLALGAALCFGLYIKMMEIHTRAAQRLMTITATQIATVAACSAAWLLVTELPLDTGAAAARYWSGIGAALAGEALGIFYLGLIATAAIISLQTWGQSHSSANEAAVIYAFEPAAAAVFGFFWLGETMTGRGWIGAALLISGMIVSQWNAERPAGALVPE